MKRRLMFFVLAAVMVMTMLPGMVLESEAAAFDDINASEVFLKQETDYTCTLAATAMLMRRRAMIEGKENWSSITESALRPVAWDNGLKGTFAYNGITITAIRKNSGIPLGELMDLLEKHPEGVVIHNDAHAVLLTDYDSETGTFYCADPAYGAQGRVPLNHPETCHYKGYGLKTQGEILGSIVHCWYAVGEVELEKGYLSKCSPITPTLAQVTGKEGNLKALPCSIETDPESFAYHSLKGKTFVVDGFCTNTAGNLWYRTSCNCGCGAEEAWVYSGDVKVDKMLYDIKLSDDAVYPTELVQDNGCNLKGTITTSHRLKEVTISVFKDALFVTKATYTGTEEINLKQSYSISRELDNKIKFSELDPGNYVFEICAVEQIEDIVTQSSKTKTHVLLKEKLTVSPRNSSSDILSLSGETYPTSLSVGQWFALKGTVTSASSNITSLIAGVYDSAGNMKTGNTVSPNSKSYNIVNIDPDVHFDWLPAGTYSYIIRATNASGTKELLNKTFTVGGGSSGSGSTIDASGRYSVTNTRNITGQDIVATARQWANEGATYWSHYDPWLPSIYWRTGYTYNGQQSFDCSGFVSRVLNDCGLRSGNYTPPYGDCILSQQYGSGFMSIQIEDLVNYGTDITAAVKRARNGDYSGLQPGDLIAWTSGSLGRHIIIYAGMKNGTPWTVEFTGNGYRDRAMPAEYQSAFQFGARLVSDAGAACSEHTKGEFLFYEGAHPHYNYYACATCGEKFSDGTFTKLSDCSTCSPTCTSHVKGMYSHCETEHPHYIYYYCNNCEEQFKSTSTTKLDTCEICTPKDTMTFSGGIFPTELTRGQRVEISGTVTSANSNLKYVETTVNDLTGKVYFTNKIDVSTKSYDLSKISDTVPFEGLPEGNYNYIVSAANATYSERVYVVRFTVKSELISDVRKGQWYYDAVQYVMKNGIMSGYNSSTFGPDDTLNRAMVVQVLYNKEGKPELNGLKHNFSDVPVNQWYNSAVTWGSNRGVVSGYGGGLFKPEDSVTIEQVAVILRNYSGSPNGNGDLSMVGDHSDWAADALKWAVEAGILDNIPFTNANENATRAQIAQMLKNYLTK